MKTDSSVVVASLMVRVVDSGPKQTVIATCTASLFVRVLKRTTLWARCAKLRIFNTLVDVPTQVRFLYRSVTMRALHKRVVATLKEVSK